MADDLVKALGNLRREIELRWTGQFVENTLCTIDAAAAEIAALEAERIGLLQANLEANTQLAQVTLKKRNLEDSLAEAAAEIARLRAEAAKRERPDFAPCPTCHQYSHTIAGGLVEEAAMHFTAMIDGRQYRFDDQTRDMAQRLIAAATTP